MLLIFLLLYLEEWVKNNDVLLFWQVKPVVHAFQVYANLIKSCRQSTLFSLGVHDLFIIYIQLFEEGPCEDLCADGQPASFNEWILPAKEFDGLWERSVYYYGLVLVIKQ